MEKYTKYYYKKTPAYLVGFVIFFFMFMYSIIDMGSIDQLLAIILDWILVVFFGGITLLLAFVSIQVYREVGYLEIRDQTLYLKNLLGQTKQVDLTEEYIVKKRNDDIKYILFLNSQQIVGDGFDLSLDALVAYLETVHQKTDE